MNSSSPAQHPAPPSVDDIDEQWENFAKDGCPDWWLMAKYTHGWLARTFPYVPFKERAASLPGDSSAGAGAAALTTAGSVPTPATVAEAPAGRSHSSSEVELLQVIPASQAASGSAQRQAQQQQQQQQLRGRAASLDSARTPEAADSTAASDLQQQQQQQQNCGNPLKGLFACQCAAPAGVDKPVEQVHG